VGRVQEGSLFSRVRLLIRGLSIRPKRRPIVWLLLLVSGPILDLFKGTKPGLAAKSHQAGLKWWGPRQ
jgi:hypothetical protein